MTLPVNCNYSCNICAGEEDVMEAGKLTAIVTDVKYRMTPAIIRDLGEAGVRVIACHTETEDNSPPLGYYSKHTAVRQTLPADGYGDALYDLCRNITDNEGRRPALLPVGAATLAKLTAPETGAGFPQVCGLCIPTREQLGLLNDKGRIAALAASLDVPVPASYTPDESEQIEKFYKRIPLPCVVKPRWGEGLGLTAALRYTIARTPEELRESFCSFSEMAGEYPIVQEYLPGAGTGCSVFAQEGKIVSSICHKRIREYPVTGGPSTCCEAVHDPRLVEWCGILAEAVGLTGPAMFEFKANADGKPRLLEVNPRIWGSYPLTRVAKTGFTYTWFAASWNKGNPDTPIPAPVETEYRQRRMVFFPSDFAAASGYLRVKKAKLTRGAIIDLLRPGVKDGLFEWGDARPALRYWRSLLRRASH